MQLHKKGLWYTASQMTRQQNIYHYVSMLASCMTTSTEQTENTAVIK